MHFKCTPRKHVVQQCGPPPPESSEQRTNIRKLSITYFISGCKKTKGWVRGGEAQGTNMRGAYFKPKISEKTQIIF